MIRRRTTPLAYTNALYSALLILVLGSAHPVLAAAIVIAGFLIFAGIGSLFCARFESTLGRIHAR